jgi:hypothetical protein
MSAGGRLFIKHIAVSRMMHVANPRLRSARNTFEHRRRQCFKIRSFDKRVCVFASPPCVAEAAGGTAAKPGLAPEVWWNCNRIGLRQVVCSVLSSAHTANGTGTAITHQTRNEEAPAPTLSSGLNHRGHREHRVWNTVGIAIRCVWKPAGFRIRTISAAKLFCCFSVSSVLSVVFHTHCRNV